MSTVVEGVLLSDVAAQCCISDQFFRALIEQGMYPSPDMRIRTREGYTMKVAKECARISRKNKLFRVTHLAKEFDQSIYYIHKLIREGRIEAPSVEVCASKFYLKPQLSKIRKQILTCQKQDKKSTFEKASKVSRIRANKWHERRRKMGRFSTKEVAEMAGLSQMTMYHHQGTGRFPKPKLEVKGYFGHYYTRKQADRIIAWLEKHSRAKKN
jgi:hypothetical protein